MADYTQIEFEHLSTGQKEIIIALLSEMKYEGFEEVEDLLKAFIPSAFYDENELTTFCERHGLFFSRSKVEDKNWNTHWESNFHPVIVGHSIDNKPWVAVRAMFHEPIVNASHELIITPKMSFGTGHHATTSMMMKMMSELDFTDKMVLDFGTGTGVLAILSEKLGAARIIAIEADSSAVEHHAKEWHLPSPSTAGQ